jgi:hypothetical protein
MTPNDTAAVLAALPDDTMVTVTIPLRAWLAAKAATQGGPEYADVSDVARIVGFSVAYWGRLARAGKIAGAVQEGKGGRWKLPVEQCRAHIRGLRRKPPAAPTRPTLLEYTPRGPRKAKTEAKTA